MKISLIYPTRNRPEFIKVALKFLESQNCANFEVIVSDNFSEPSLSCLNYIEASNLKNIRYFRPPNELSMVENWNFALQFATGEYVCYLTDKMFMLPNFITYLSRILVSSKPDIISWTCDTFIPNNYSNYFGEGIYIKDKDKFSNYKLIEYDSKIELDRKGLGKIRREMQSDEDYCRGKIVFGCYSMKLIANIIKNTGALFHNIAPDYTSMILGLTYADNVIEIKGSGALQMSTDISNGGLTRISDLSAYNFLLTLKDSETILSNLLIPKLYSSQHNIVAHDYTVMKKKYNLHFSFSQKNWLFHIKDDLLIPERYWSSDVIESSQKSILENYMINNFFERDSDNINSFTYRFKKIIFKLYRKLSSMYLRILFHRRKKLKIKLNSIYDILNNY